jgi:hypothetical protein
MHNAQHDEHEEVHSSSVYLDTDIDPNKERLFDPYRYEDLIPLIKHRLSKITGIADALKIAKGKRTQSEPQKQAIFDLGERLKNLEQLNNPAAPFKKYSDFTNRKALTSEINRVWGSANLNPKQIATLIDMEIERLTCYQVIRYFEKELLVIQGTYENLSANHTMGVSSRLKGRKINAKKNDAILHDCLKQVRKLKKTKKWEESDYIEFRRLALMTKPAFIPVPRVAGESKKLTSLERQTYIARIKRETWSESKLRKFFREQTDKKASTKVKSLID